MAKNLKSRGLGLRRGWCGPWLTAALAKGHAVALAATMPSGLGKVANRAIRWLITPLYATAGWWQHYTGVKLDSSEPGRPLWPKMAKWLRRGRRLRGRLPQPKRRASAAKSTPATTTTPPVYSASGQYYLPLLEFASHNCDGKSHA